MEKEKNSTSEHRVLGPKKERKRRLVLSSDSEPEDHVASAGPKMDETASGDFGGGRSEEDDKSRAIEEIETDTDILYPKLNQEENKEAVLDPKSDNYASESGDVKLIEKKAESVFANIGKNKEVLSWNIDKYLGSMKHRDKDIHQGWNKEKALGFRYDKSRRMDTGNAEVSRNKMKLDHARSHTEKTGGSNKSFNSMKHHMHRTLDKVRGDKEKDLRFVSYKKRSTEFGDSEVSREKTKSEHLKSYAENAGESNRKLDFKKHRDTDIYQAWDNEKALGFRSDKKRSMETDDFEVSGMTRKPTHAEDLVEKVGRNNKMLDSRKYQDQDMHQALDKDKVLGFKNDQKRSTETGDVEISRKKAKSEHLENHVEKVGGINNKSNFIKHKDKSTTDGVLDFIGGLSGSDTVTKAKQIGVDKLIVQKLLVSSNESSRKVDEKSRHDEQSGPEEIVNHLDNKVSRIESKREENGGKSQHEYIRVQGKSGVLKILHHNTVSISRDANARHEIEHHSRKLSLPNTGKLNNSNDLTKRYGTEKSKFKIKLDKNARQVSAEGRSNRNGDKSKPDNSSALKGYKSLHLTQAKSSTDDGGESASGVRSSSPAKHAVKESIASRNEVKRKVREQIKTILLDSGWKIELRPRRGRDYEDAVYVSPQGTGYWSITKAYDVYRKQLNNASDDNKDAAKHEGRSSTSATIAPEVLILLKRNVVNRRKHKKEVVKLKHKGGKKRKKAKQTTKASCSEDKETSNVAGENRAKKRRNKSSALLDGSSAKKMRLLVRNQKKRCCTLLVRGYSQDEESEKSEYVPYIWKRTILSWMIDMGVLPAYGKVRYVNKSKNKTMLEGRVTRDGIHCSCCSKILTVPKFAIHAGSKLHQPYENTLVEASGISLLQCQINAWEKQEDHKRYGFYKINTDGDDPNDDTCTICADGGDLICCDGCPSTFHINCLGLQTLPPGDWHCKNCSCKFCGMRHDPASCKSLPTLISCTLCEQKYHEGCAADEDAVSAAPSSSSNRFCGRSCQRVFRRLHKLIGVKNELEAGYYWSIIRRFDDLSKSPIKSTQRVESNSKIAVAHGVIDECFLPITDHRSGINLIDNVVYNCRSNFNRLNYSGFYTFILERSDEIICAASVRIHGTRFAEMPFIGTRNMYRRQGMCRRLFEGIESALSYFGTEMLVIPAISELTDTWTSVFGFKPLEVSLKEEIKCVNMLVFPGIGLLQKSLLKETTVQHSILRQVAKPKSEMISHVFGGSKAETQKSVGEDQKISVNENETAPVHLGNVLQAFHESNLFPSSLEQQTHDTGNQAIHQISVNTDKSVHSDHESRNCCTSEAANFMRSNENTQFELETNANERNAINSLGVEGVVNIFIASNSESEQISLSDKENKHDIQLIVVSDIKSSAVEHESTAKPQCVDDGNALEDSNERKLFSCSTEQCTHEFNGNQASHQSFMNTEKSSHTDHKPKNYCTSQVTNYLNSNENNHSKLESNANDANATVSFGVERHLIICSDAKPESKLIAHAIDGNKPEIQQSQFLGFEGSAIEHEPATEHQLSDDRHVLEASHESNLFPCSLEQQACKFIGSQTSHQTSMSTDKSAHTENMSRNSCISEVVNSTSALSNAQYEVGVNVKESNPKISSGVEKLLNTCSNKNDLSASFGNREGSIVVDGMEATKLEKIELPQFQEKHHGTGDPFSRDESQFAHYFLTELQHCNDRPALDASHGSNMLSSTSELIVSDFIEYQASHKIIGNADKSAHTDQKTKDCFTSDVSNNVRASKSTQVDPETIMNDESDKISFCAKRYLNSYSGKNGLASSLINGEVYEVVNGNEITDRHIFQEKTELHHLSVDLHGEGDAAARVEFLEKHVSMHAQPPYLTKHEDRQALEPSHESNLISYSPELNACEFIGNQASQQVSLNTDYSSQQVSMNTDNSTLADYDSRNDCTSEVTNHMSANENIYIDTGSCYALNSVDSMRHIVAMHSVSCGLDDASDSINCLDGTNAASEGSPKKSMVSSERADKNVSIGTCEAGIGICTDITNNCHEGSCDRIAEGDLGVAESVHVLNISSVSPVSKAVT